MTIVDLDRLAQALADTAEAEIMPRWRNLEAGEIQEKTGPNDLVTVADEAAEAMLARTLPDLLAGSILIGEESVEKDRTLLERIKGDAPVWIVDPIDGTNNFAKGSERFCVMAALTQRGETIASAIHQPVEGRTAVAAKGEGAWMLQAGERTRLRVTIPSGTDVAEGSFNFRFFPEEVRAGIRERANAVLGDRHHRRGCAGFDYMRIATGDWHFAAYWKDMPWDHAPGLLIVEEAGGGGARLDGAPYDPSDLRGGLLTATSDELWREIRERVVGEG